MEILILRKVPSGISRGGSTKSGDLRTVFYFPRQECWWDLSVEGFREISEEAFKPKTFIWVTVSLNR